MMSIDVWPMWAGTIVVVISRRTAALTVFILTAVILAFVAWMIIWSGRHRR